MVRKQKTKKRRILWIVLGSVFLVLLALRIALPYILLSLANRKLAELPDYRGHINDIDVALIRGAFKIKNFRLDKKSGKVPVPFLSTELVDFSIQWKALFHGRIVGEISVEHPVVNFVKGPNEATTQTRVEKKLVDALRDLMPLKLNRAEIKEGEIHYLDFYSTPKINVYCRDVHIVAENLSNGFKVKDALPSTVDATAAVYGGHATLHMKINPMNEIPTFDAKAELVSLDITNLNNFLEAYGKLDVKQGTISIYTEAAAKDKKIIGYTKPIIKDLKVVNWEKDKEKPLKLIKEAIVGAVAWIFKNHSEDQLATKAEFEGNIKDPDVSVLYIIGEILHNAFIQALYPALENSVNIHSLDKKPPETPLKKQFEQGAFKDKKK